MDIITASGAYTSLDADRGGVVKLTGAVAQAITLDTTLGDNWAQTFWNQNTGAGVNNYVTLTPSSGTINGAASLIIFLDDVVTVICDGTNWTAIYLHQAPIFSMNVDDVTLAAFVNGTTDIAWLESGRGTLSVPASTLYRFKAQIHTYNSGARTSHTTSFNFLGAGTATLTDIRYQWVSGAAAAGGQTSGTSGSAVVGTATVIMSAQTATDMYTTIKGHFRTNAAGTIVPAIRHSADPINGGVIKSRKGSFFWCEKLGAAALGSSGQWAS